jgi:hypothetical protein
MATEMLVSRIQGKLMSIMICTYERYLPEMLKQMCVVRWIHQAFM